MSEVRIDSPRRVGFCRLFTYAHGTDFLYILVGLLSAVGMGIIQPLLFFFVGDIYRDLDPYSTKEEYYDKAVEMTYQMLIWGSVYCVVSYIAVVAWIRVGTRQAHNFRREYLKAILKQDVSWFDGQPIAQLPGSLTADTIRVEKATGDKLVALIFISVMVLVSLIISLRENVQLTLLALVFSPLMAGGLAVTNRTMEKTAKQEDEAYHISGGIAEEALSEIKTVAAFNSQAQLSTSYSISLTSSYLQMLKDGLTIGVSTGVSIGGFLGMLAATVVAGATMIRNHEESWSNGAELTVGKVIIVMFVCMMAFHNTASLLPCIKIMVEGQTAASAIFRIIRSKPSIVSGSRSGDIKGAVEFRDVSFAYANRALVLESISFSLSPGESLAVVGETGSGKSTVVSLLMRFYDPSAGTILVDGVDLKEYELAAFRTQVGLVSQEPVLFNDSIKNNLMYAAPHSSEDELKSVLAQAQALDFINILPLGLDTQVGNKGSQLSGGEKQRIAIARAMLRRPKILLLDEATSALDKNTEARLQTVFNGLMTGRTTIIIAHRVSTIRTAKKVIVLSKGKVAENGSQEELLQLQGKFYHMVKMQEMDVGGERADLLVEDEKVNRSVAEDQETIVTAPGGGHFMRRFLKMTSKYWVLMLLGSLGAVLVGAGYPFNGLMMGFEIHVLTTTRGETLEQDSRFYGGLFGACAGSVFLGLLLQALTFPLLSAKSTRELRKESFRSLLCFDLEFFDRNNSSAVASRLSTDCQKINGLGGSIFGLLAGMVCSLVTAYTISGLFCWQIALIILLTLPVQLFSMVATFLAQIQGLVAYSYDDATAFASDCILNYKTVKSFCAESALLSRYLEVTLTATKLIQRKSHVSGLCFGLGYGLLFYIYGLIFWFGAYMFREDIVSFRNMNIAIFAAIAGTSSVFVAGIFAPDVQQGQVAAKNLFKLMDYEPKIDVNSADGCRDAINGTITFEGVEFAYPTRKMKALAGVSFSVPCGSSLAIVGTTGSGKSTVIQLLLRFYDPSKGLIKIDGRDLRQWNLHTLRGAIGLVSQEPVLFSGTVAKNVALGDSNVDLEKVKRVTAQAQAGVFLEASPEGYNREVGAKGALLSGGEKQRIAVARALYKDPRIFLLDEATSALDSTTEQALMTSLQQLSAGRTIIAIAHRVKTISDFDQIAVMSEGRLVEMGKLEELMKRRGYFYSLAQQM